MPMPFAIARSASRRHQMRQWTDPAYSDIRLGFEVTAYVYVR
jgi:coenzyme PQQ precursor peptide PqqA